MTGCACAHPIAAADHVTRVARRNEKKSHVYVSISLRLWGLTSAHERAKQAVRTAAAKARLGGRLRLALIATCVLPACR